MKYALPLLLLALVPPAFAQSGPEPLVQNAAAVHVLDTAPAPVRLAHDPTTDALYYLTTSGDLYRIDPLYAPGREVLAYTAADHGAAGQVLGLALGPEGTLYLVGNERQEEAGTTVATVVRGRPDGAGGHTWSVVARTAPYPRSNTPFDHSFNAVAVSPDGATLYLNSGSRTDHGEVQDHDGRFPGTREVPLTSAILRIPADADGLLLPNDAAALRDAGILFADGTRNSFDLAFGPDGHLFGTDNAGDRDDPDELNWLREGHHYGFPWTMGGHLTPMQVAGYDPELDRLLNPAAPAAQNGFFYDDPDFPVRPDGLTFTPPIPNRGPDADRYRDPHDGLIYDLSDEGVVLRTFTPHRSPLGLVFDTEGRLPGDYAGGAFVLSWTGADESELLAPFGDEGEDLLHLALRRTDDGYETTATRLVRGFDQPIDAVIAGDEIYVLEYGGQRIWAIHLDVLADEEPDAPAPAFTLDVFPNPAAQAARIAVSLPAAQAAHIDLLDLLGRRRAVLHEGVLPAGTHRVDVPRRGLPPGLYMVRVQAGPTVLTRPLLFVP
ncbi:MAG: PQQ-dependent sugar dehydrogenase [Rhodothermales bacterium]|nr:PQQ-dependent sugar dehydrogenase [Rhodothermales bacterium]